eukprot:1346602-Amphidinium_carterae.1
MIDQVPSSTRSSRERRTPFPKIDSNTGTSPGVHGYLVEKVIITGLGNSKTVPLTCLDLNPQPET